MSKLRKFGIATISLFLAFILLFETTPANLWKVLAEEISNLFEKENVIEQEYYYGSMVDKDNIGNGYILQENVENRTATTKEFLMSDNTIMVQQFIEPIHYYENGVYKDIDNSLIEFESDGGIIYENNANSFNIKFSQNGNGNKHLIEIEEYGAGFTISYKAKKEKEPKIKIKNDKKDGEIDYKNEKIIRPNNDKVPKGQLTYEGIEENTDFVYKVKNKQLSKNIIINKVNDEYSYRLELESDNLQFIKNDDGIISIINELGEIKFEIPVPYMLDNEGNHCAAISTELKEKGNKVELIITADSKWINEEAKLPVTIVPEIKSKTNNSFSFVNVFENGENITNSKQVYIGKKNGAKKSDAFLNFKLPEVAPYYQLIGASVSLSDNIDGKALANSQSIEYDMYLAKSTEDLTSVTYAQKPSKISTIDTKQKNGVYESDIINTNNIESNTMTVGVSADESISDDSYIALATTANETSVLYWYQQVIGIKDKYSMESSSIDGVTSYVNNSTGQLAAVVDLVSINTLSDMPLEVSLIYNDYYNIVLDGINKTSYVGNNFKLNFQQYVYGRQNDNGQTVYEYIDADGSITTFKQTGNNAYYSAEKGLTFNSATGIMNDTLGNTMVFSNGKLTKIYSTNTVENNSPTEYIEIVYQGTTDMISNIKCYLDSVEAYSVSMTYLNNKLASLATSLGMEKDLTYDEDGNLISAEGNGTTAKAITIGYETVYYDSQIGMLNYLYNNLKEGLIFDRDFDDTIDTVRTMAGAGVMSENRCVSSISFGYYGIYTKIYYYDNGGYTNMRYVSFNNTREVISEWQPNTKGIVAVKATTGWRNYENLTTTYTKETVGYHHGYDGYDNYGLPEGSTTVEVIDNKTLGIADNEENSFNSNNYRFAVVFQLGVSDTESELVEPISLMVKIGNSITENIYLSQGGHTYVCIPCEYYTNNTEVRITNNGNITVGIMYFNYEIIDSITETNTYYSNIKSHKLTSSITYLRSGVRTQSTYDEHERLGNTSTTRLETGDMIESTTYSYYPSSSDISNIAKGKIEEIVTSKNSVETERTNYTYSVVGSEYTETVTSDYDGLKTKAVNKLNRNTKTIEQIDENNINVKYVYSQTQGDNRLTEIQYADTIEKYTYNDLGQITETSSYDKSNPNVAISTQLNTYDTDGIYLGSSYNGESYTYADDETGFVTSISKSGLSTPLLQYSYYSENNNLSSNKLYQKTYANENVENYTYSNVYTGNATRRTQVEYKNSESGNVIGSYRYNYNSEGAMTSQSHLSNGSTQLTYDYGDLDNRKKQELTISGLEFYMEYTNNYDVTKDRVTSSQIYSLIGCATTNFNTIRYSYNDKGQLSGLNYDSYDVDYSYDAMGRLSSRIIAKGYDGYYLDKVKEQYIYKTSINDGVSYTSNLLSCIDDQTEENNDRTSTYDSNGYITGVSYNGINYTYTYDKVGRLTSETNNWNGTTTYSYDSYNNVQKEGLVYTNGLLTSANDAPIVYDNMGNPTTYKGNNFTWTQGRKLTSGSMNGKNFAYEYDGNGMRYEKTVNGTTTSYYYNGTQLLMESQNGDRIFYIYGVTGIEGMIINDGNYRTDTYYFDKNTLGDIIAIRDMSGIVVAKYEYDAWGNTIVMDANGYNNTSATFIGNKNPFRYRGYYYDNETGFYYLQTRYYDPDICRFINADNYELIPTLAQYPGQLNMYAYCNNNPIMYTDPSGEWIFFAIIMAVFTITGGVTGYVVGKEQGHEGWELVGDILLGGAIGAATGGLTIATTSVIGGSIAAMLGKSFSLFGMGALESFALGSAIYNTIGLIVAPIIGEKFQPIEWGSNDKPDKINSPSAIISPLATYYCV